MTRPSILGPVLAVSAGGGRIALTLMIGFGGGLIFLVTHMPLPWVLGSIFAVLIAALARLPVRVPMPLRMTMTTVLGVFLGGHFHADFFARITDWALSLLAMMAALTASMVIVFFFLRRFGRYPLTEAFFSAVPGGVNDMELISAHFGADRRIVALSHSCRLFLTVAAVPYLVLIFDGEAPERVVKPMSLAIGMPFADAMILVVCAASGWIVARWLRLPGAPLIGPMILSGFAHFQGFVTGAPPDWLLAVAQIVVGSTVGSRFVGISYGLLARTMALSAVSTVIMLNFSTLAALIVGLVTGLPVDTLFMAYAPGGQVEMSLLALSVDGDVAFVSLHSTFRATVYILLSPIGFRLLRLIQGKSEPPAVPFMVRLDIAGADGGKPR